MIDYYKINEEIVSKIGNISQKIPENTWENSEFWEIPLVILILFFLFSITAMILSVSDAEFFLCCSFWDTFDINCFWFIIHRKMFKQ